MSNLNLEVSATGSQIGVSSKPFPKFFKLFYNIFFKKSQPCMFLFKYIQELQNSLEDQF